MTCNYDYDLVFIIVDKKLSTRVSDEIEALGVSGLTILQGRGRSTDQKVRLLGLTVEPQREMILVLTPNDKTRLIFDTALQAGKLDRPGNGLVFVVDVKMLGGVDFAKS